MKARFYARAVSLILLCASALPILGQGTSSLRGVVYDPGKAAVAGSKVSLIDKETGALRSTLTLDAGQYQFLQIRPGTYSMTVEAEGFAVSSVDGIKLLVDTPVAQDVYLKLAGTTTSISVIADAAPLNMVNASVGNAFEERQIQELPIQTRNAAALLSLQPGVTSTGEVTGARRDQNNITLDGVDANDNQNPLSGLNGTSSGSGFNSAIPVPLDSVQEFRVTVAGSGASDGRSSGGQVSLVTRSGSNTLHGTAYSYNRNTAFAANNWFNNRSGLARPALIRNQFGASLGGPIRRDKAFIFMNYERRLDNSQATQSRTVPSETLKQGLMKFQTTNGATYTMTPADIAQADPKHIGISPTMLAMLNQYPVGNNPAGGADQGLNFTGLRFNAPNRLDYRTYVAKLDFSPDASGKHSLSFRGTLSNQDETNASPQFPGQASASTLLSNNRGFGIRYTTLLTPTMTNTVNLGLTRIGYGSTGSNSTSVSFANISSLENFTRGSTRINPNWSLTDDFTWLAGNHTITAGFAVRWFDNALSNYGSSFPTYAFNRNQLVGLGADINAAVLNVVAPGNTTLKLTNGSAVTSAMGDLLGTLTNGTVTYNYKQDGSVRGVGEPTIFDIVTNTYEGYIQDNWKITPKLSVNLGLRYMYSAPPYEATGLQVAGSPSMDQYFANRITAMENGVSGFVMPGAGPITFNLSGPKHGKASWYKPDRNNFAPRVSIAYSPTSKTVFRAGGAIVYDQYGNDLASNIASLGSMGLTSTQGFPISYDFSNAPRYNGALPSLPSAPNGAFPFTPPLNYAITSDLYGIYSDLVAPYAVTFNASLAHEFPGGLTMDVGYVGRLSRKTLTEQNVGNALLYFKDNKSGLTLNDADIAMRLINDAGVTPAQVKANPALVAINPFVENMFPGLANNYITGSASANYFYGIYGNFAGSGMDHLSALDRVVSAKFPNCIVVTGCFTFFAPQITRGASWTNAGAANYHGLIVSIRRPLRKGIGFDLNYTWSHSIDNASTSASGSFTGRGTMLTNAFRPGLSRDSSDFDVRHQFNANFIYELPFGHGKMLLDNSPKWLNLLAGGWQLSGIITTRSGLPTTINGSGAFSTNFNQGNQAVPVSGTPPVTGSLVYNQLGNPSIFANTSAVSLFKDYLPGGVGKRGIVRLPWQRNVDASIIKSIPMPFESQSLQFRAEAFNVFNYVNFTSPSLSISSPGTFGQFASASDARVMQMSLRYSF